MLTDVNLFRMAPAKVNNQNQDPPPPPPPPPAPWEKPPVKAAKYKRPDRPAHFPEDPAELETVSALGGSTGARLVRDPKTGKKYVLKKGNNADHVREEFVADEIYRSLGVAVPKAHLYETKAGPVKLAEYIEHSRAERVAVTIFGINLFLVAIVVARFSRHALRGHLIDARKRDDEVRALTKRLEPGVAGYFALIALGLFFPLAAACGYLVLALAFLTPVGVFRRLTHPAMRSGRDSPPP